MQTIRKWLVVGIIFLFIGTAVFPTAATNIEKSSSASRGHWLYVGGSGPGNYTKIQDAINNASDGDTVFVYDDSAPYNESVSITKSIYLCGENTTTTIIHGGVGLAANDTIISYFTIFGHISEGWHGDSPPYRNITISHNIINWSVWLGPIVNVTISSNIILTGIFLGGSRVTITGNTIDRASYLGCCYLIGTNNCTISGNNITNGNYGIFIDGNCQHITIVGNTISHCGALIYSLGSSRVDIRRNNFKNNSRNAPGIILSGCRWTQVVENNFINTSENCIWIMGFFNIWDRNYWGHPRLLPKPIYSSNRFILRYLLGWLIHGGSWEPRYPYLILVPLALKYDWHPARQPYDIP